MANKTNTTTQAAEVDVIPAEVLDYFDSEINSKVDPNPRTPQPYLVPLNKSQKQAGWILSKENARNCGWVNYNYEAWQEHCFEKASDEVIYIPNPRFLVLHATKLILEHKETGDRRLLDWDEYQLCNPEETKIFRNYMLLLVDDYNQPLHTKKPLQLKAHGFHGLTLTQALLGNTTKDRKPEDLPAKGFYQQLEEAAEKWMLSQGKKFERPKTHFNSVDFDPEPWHRLSVAELIMKPTLVGKDKTSWVSKVVGFKQPTPETAHEFYAKTLIEPAKDLLAAAPRWNSIEESQAEVQVFAPALEGADDFVLPPGTKYILEEGKAF